MTRAIDFDAIAAEFSDAPDAPMPDSAILHTARLWRWTSPNSDAPAAWFFVTIDGAAGAVIRAAAGPRRGFGSVKIIARIGSSEFATSLFPHKDSGGYFLPVKATVRKAECLTEGDDVTVELRLA